MREPVLLDTCKPQVWWETVVTLNSLAFVGLSPQRVLMLFEDNFLSVNIYNSVKLPDSW